MSEFSERLMEHLEAQAARIDPNRQTLGQMLRGFLGLEEEDSDRVINEPDSTAVDRAEYEDSTSTLYITYTNGRRYAYFPVPRAIFEEYLVAGSKGGFVNFFLKPLFMYREV